LIENDPEIIFYEKSPFFFQDMNMFRHVLWERIETLELRRSFTNKKKNQNT